MNSPKKLQQIPHFFGQCCPFQKVQGNPSPELTCIICFQMMTQPVTLICGGNHTFGMYCIQKCISNKETILCPLCRRKVKQWKVKKQLSEQLRHLKGECQYCGQKINISKFPSHIDTCPKYHSYLISQIKRVVKSIKSQLEHEINPHLRECHAQIFNKHVREWEWLEYDSRDWKWWWWSHNPWWNGACNQCNKLWLKYDKKIDILEQERINIIQLEQVRFAEVGIKGLFGDQ